ncbi:hypothetical protein FAM09_24775 [Niastella caeni]|uniref:Uncharacterized protein n=1 Tax=Niastella caeni TaxID=2569763 RepID=A0A4V4GZW2_9BACT|nr:hypothetical protein [Niastella caeni]THU34236.1 hypothetical protein FAM09_24775 [Niastella caeni]
MIYTIFKGRNRARPWRFGFWWNRKCFAWAVKFEESCRYDLQSGDQYDINKLVGIGYLPNHHKHSARFGWSYQLETGKIELHAYCYVNGARVKKSIALCDIGKDYRIGLRISSFGYHFTCDEKHAFNYQGKGYVIIAHRHKKKFCYRLGIYFGGNQPAPHEMEIQIIKV